jgi:hypothetical protein
LRWDWGGKSKPLWSKCDPETKDMSTPLTLSGGHENLRLRKLSTTCQFSPDKSLKEKESDCCTINLVTCPNFFTDVVAWFYFSNFSIWLASNEVFRRKLWRERFGNMICDFCLSCFIWYWLLLLYMWYR